MSQSALFKLEQAVHVSGVTIPHVADALAEVIGQFRGKTQHLSETNVLDTELGALEQILTGINNLPAPMIGVIGSALTELPSLNALADVLLGPVPQTETGTTAENTPGTPPVDAPPATDKPKRPSRARKGQTVE